MITLVIVGVIAAITVPTLITKYQKEQTVTRYKKAYSELSQSLVKAQITFGFSNKWNLSDYPSGIERNQHFLEEYIIPNMSIITKCIPSSDQCWSNSPKALDNTPLTTGKVTNQDAESISFVTASGYSIYFWVSASSANIRFFVDINGPSKGPNKVGRDIFQHMFLLSDGKMQIALGAYNPLSRDVLLNTEKYGCSKQISGKDSGLFCGDLIRFDSWQIKDDYPW